MTRNKDSKPMTRALTPLYIATIFLSAFLLFAVQPMVGKYLLPLLGGTPSVWNTAMVFFQLLLLAGYIYAHLLTKIKNPKVQAILHITLILAACISLPIALGNDPDATTDHPIQWQLQTMLGMAAAPFLMLSASAPLLQKWFSHTSHPDAHNPYFLYAASNIGSMLALLSYPFVVEPLLGLKEQSFIWAIGYGVLAVLFCLSAFSGNFKPQTESISTQPTVSTAWTTRLKWIFLAFCPSSLMLGYTTYITTDIASAPLFWVFPLALYLGTFIIAFSTRPLLRITTTRFLYGFSVLFLLSVNLAGMHGIAPWFTVLLHTFLFFFAALMCHQELVATKPDTSKLTEFYLLISFGGALGGIFNSLIAPLIFKLPLEYYVVIALTAFALKISEPDRRVPMLEDIRKNGWSSLLLFPGILLLAFSTFFFVNSQYQFMVGAFLLIGGTALYLRRLPFILTVVLVTFFATPYSWEKINNSLLTERNFFGVLRIQDYPKSQVRLMSNGTTTHGAQALVDSYKKIPLTYYYMGGPVGEIFAEFDSFPSQKIAALGLGVGSIACYTHEGRTFDFYEINPAVIRIAEDPAYFTYLRDCGSPYKMVLGDARKKISLAQDQSYDMIFVDVFSSDNIPVHVMTLEAMELYKRKLKPGGIIVVHISNRFFNLKKEIGLLGNKIGMPVLTRYMDGKDVPGSKLKSTPSSYTVLSENKELMERLGGRGWTAPDVPHNMKPWTDDFADIVRAITF